MEWVIVTGKAHKGGLDNMENTTEFVQKLNDNQEKQRKNKQGQATGHPEKKLPNKQH